MIIRGSLVSLIYHRSLEVESGKHEDGSVVTLLNTDVENIDSVGEMFHETWAQFLEVLVGTALLARQIGWLSPVPLFITFREFWTLIEVETMGLTCFESVPERADTLPHIFKVGRKLGMSPRRNDSL